MADVITKCVNGSPIQNGATMAMSNAGKNATNSFHKSADGINQDTNKLENKWTNRFDDITYYTA